MRKIFLLLFIYLINSGSLQAQSTITLTGYPIVTTGWTVENSASAVDSEIVLTTSSGGEYGEVYYNTEENLTGCGQFTVDFDWQITSPGGISVADGIAFWFINPLTGVGGGGGLGIPEPITGYLLTFDTYDNDGDGLNPENEMFGFTTATTYAESLRAQLLCGINGHNSIIDDGSWHHCHISYNGGTIRVYWDYSTTVAMTGTFAITSPGWFGFSAGTGGGWSKQSIKRVAITYGTISEIVGPTTLCVGSSSSLGDSTTGGTWVSTNTAAVTIGSTTGNTYGVALGTSIVSYIYNSGACWVTTTVTVAPPPNPISGIDSMCVSATTTLTDATSGGTWVSSRTTVATVGSTTGFVTGAAQGSLTVTYTMGGACYVTQPMTVYPNPTAITGTPLVCSGYSITLGDGVTGGFWTSGNTSVATAGTGGVITGVSAGTTLITYAFGINLCQTTITLTVNASPAAISGSPYICPGTSTSLGDATSGGIWSSNHTSVATVGSTTGLATGVSAGTAVISYTLSSNNCFATRQVTVYPLPGFISGGTVMCAGTTTLMTDPTTGGTWSSGNTSVATTGTASGTSTVVTGVAAGTAIISYSLLATGCYSTTTVTVNPDPTAIYGTPQACQSLYSTLGDATSGGTWSSSDYTVASAGSSTGVITGVLAGSVTISYTLTTTGCYATTLFTVYPTPDPISGLTSVCLGQSTTLSDVDGAGIWVSSNTSVATVGSTSGIVYGASIGLSTISFYLPTGCYTTTDVTVYPNPGPISGPSILCIGSGGGFTDGGGGTWSSSNPAVAPIVPTIGSVTGASAGTTIITYTLSTGCFTTTTLTVIPSPTGISGSFNVCTGNSTTLTDGVTGGTWTSSNTSMATIGSLTGIVNGVATGTAIITYSLGGSCRTTHIETVYASPAVVTGTTTVCAGSSVTLTDGTTGGTWSSSNSTVATASGTVGTVSGVSAGTAIISYKIANGCISTTNFTVNPTPTAITGTPNVCVGSSTTLGDGVLLGLWSGGGTVASVGSSTGVVTGATAGTTTITYSFGSCRTTTGFTVNPLPAGITGTLVLCAGSTTTLGDVTLLGTWSSSNITVATIGTSGIVAGISSGTSLITYKVPTGCFTTTTVTINAAPSAISGPGAVCTGDSIAFTDLISGGNWISNNTAVATVGSVTGEVTGVGAGTTLITYTLGTSCIVSKNVTVYASPAHPSGPAAICVLAVTTLSDVVTGGTWVSGATAVGTIGSLSGTLTGIALGTTIVTYTAPGGCVVNDTISVSPTPTAIIGPNSVCNGSSDSYTDLVTGGIWTPSTGTVATIGSTSGILSAASTGTVIITYSLGSGCTVYKTVTVIAAPAAISGVTSICSGNTTTLTETSLGGNWVSGNVAVGTVNTGGVVYGVNSGTVIISYIFPSGCAATTTVNVSATPSAITGPNFMCSGDSVTLVDGVSGGVWSSNNVAVAMAGTAGVITGVGAGTTLISYTLGGTCYATKSVTVYASPGAIGGPSAVCVLSSMTLTNSVTGGTWTSSNSTVATIGTGTGLVNGLLFGTSIITYVVPGGCLVSRTIAVSPTPTPITGSVPVCAGSQITLNDGVTGGTWFSNNTTIATIGSISGTVTGVSNGTTLVTYSLGSGCTAITTVTVIPAPSVIAGPSSVCIGSTISLTDGTLMGTWSSGNVGVGTISTSGNVYGVAAGSTIITYTIGDGCYATRPVTVNPLPSAISGTMNICVGTTTTLTDPTSGGTWNSGNTAVATIGLVSGAATGVGQGTSIITYTLSGGCSITSVMTVNPQPSAISGVTSVCVAAATNLGDLISGGTWSSSNIGVATVGSLSGSVLGMSSGSAIITYTLPAGCMTVTTVTVKTSPAPISGSTNMCVSTSTTLTDAVTGGTWGSTNTSVATIGLTSGIANGITVGSTIITYTLSSGCWTTTTLIVNPTATGILGPLHICTGSCYLLSDAISGGSWSSTSTGTATIGSTGLVCGVSSGTTIITYLIGAGCLTSATVTVDNPPSAILGTTVLCENTCTTLHDPTLGGTWSSGNTAIASVGTSGQFCGVSGGNAFITYTIPNGCVATTTVTVNPISNITGPSSVCQYSSITLGDIVTGGTWVSNDVTIGTIDATFGVFTGIAPGSTIITYSLSTGCTATRAVTVNAVPANIMGTDNVCIGQTTTLTDGTLTGAWSSGSTGIATISGTGLVSGITAGTSMITYRLPTGCQAETVITVNPLPVLISGAVNICQGSSITVSDAVTGGSWSATGDITIGSSSGMITGASAGSAIITYTLGSGCITTASMTIYPTPSSITGSDRLCVDQSTGLGDSYPGGIWTSSNTVVATIGTGTGIVTGMAAGTAVISYSLSTGCSATVVFTVVPLPSVISGASALCVGGSATLTDLTLGGTWTSGNTSIAVIDSVTGFAQAYTSGTVLISYTIGSGCMVISSIIVNPLSPVDGPSVVCPGQSILLSDTTEGGTWSSSNTARATAIFAGDTIGMVTGVTSGIVTISYTLPSGCVATKNMTVNPTPLPISGTLQVCTGQTTSLSDPTFGGTWASSNTVVAGITTGGMVAGNEAGTATISYSVGGCPATATVTVNPIPDPIVGNTSVCLSNSTILTDAIFGGTWTSSNISVAPVGYTTGFVTGAALGSATVTYMFSTGCYVTTEVVVNPVPGAISGNPNICVGATTTLHDAVSLGVWSSANLAVGTVDLTGDVTGISTGTVIITYSLGTGCFAVKTVSVIALPPAISGSSNICQGDSVTLTDALSGGTWSSSASSIATVGSLSGIVKGITTGPATITYLTTLGIGCEATLPITVNPLPLPITGSAKLCVGLSTTFTDFSSGGTWSSSIIAVGTIDELGGVLAGESAGTTIVSYTLPTGCSAFVTATVYPFPGPITGDLTVCLGNTSSLSDSVHGGSWYSANTDIATVGLTTGLVRGDSLSYTDIIYIIGPGCSSQATVTVVPLPNAYLVTGGGSYCAGGNGVSIGLDSSDGGTNYLLYRGITATGAFPGTGFALNFGLQTVAGVYTVVAINTTTGCTNVMRGSATVVITPTVVPGVRITSSGRDTVCSGTSVTYAAVPAHGGPTPAYEWNVNGTNVGLGSTYTYIPANGDVVKVTMTSDTTCPLPDTAVSTDTINVQMLQTPSVNFTTLPGDTVCQGISVTFYAVPGFGGSAPVYSWIKDGSAIGSGPSFTYIPANGDTMSCFITSNFPCLIVDTAGSHKVVMTVDTPLIPTVTISANPGTSVDPGGTVTFTANVINGGSDPTYQWFVNSVPIASATSRTFTKTGFDKNFEDSVSVVVTSSGICPMSTHNWVYIEVSDEAVKNTTGGFSDFSVLPNPNKGNFTIKGNLGTMVDEEITIEITDLLGQSIYQNKVIAHGGTMNAQVDLGNNIANGMYMLNLHSATANQVFHIVVEQ